MTLGRVRHRAFALGLVLCVAFGSAAPAVAATFIQPSNGQLQISVSRADVPGAVTVAVGGFSSGSLVYIEQCDGVAPTASSWSPTIDCDLGSSPSAAIVSSDGAATFPAADKNRAFHPFLGESPQSLFNCTGAGVQAPKNDLRSYDNCKVRVSTNNEDVTADQVFLGLQFTRQSVTDPPQPKPQTTRPASDPARRRSKASQRSTSTSTTLRPQRSRSKSATVGPRSAAPNVSGAPRCASGCSARARAADSRTVTPGLLAVGHNDVAIGYIVLLVGVLLAVVSVLMRRRASRADVRQKDDA